MDNRPLPFPRDRQPRQRVISTAPTPDLYAAILRRLDALAEEIAGIEAFVVELAAREGRRR